MIRGEVSVFSSNILKLTSGRIKNLYIAGNIFLSPDLAEVVEVLVSNLGNIELVVSLTK